MADENDTGGRKALDFGKDGGRIELALHCTMQIEPMVQAMMDAARDDAEGLKFLIAAVGHRLQAVNGIACRALMDDKETLDDLYYELHGEHMPADAKELVHG